MTNPGDPDIVGLVRSLTDKQKACILAMRDDGGFSYAKEIGAAGITLNRLWDRWDGEYGLSNLQPLIDRDVCDMPLSYIWGLNDLGLRVRAHLLDNPS